MAKAKPKSKSAKKSARPASRGRSPSRPAGTPVDAVALLKADHRQVEEWFGQFEKTRSDARKERLAQDICLALTVHAQIEEEIFYPAFLEATGNEDIHHEAIIEHDGARKLIAEIRQTGASDDYFDARISVLAGMIQHHVKEEEQRDGMFAKARAADLDLKALGERVAARRKELMAQAASGDTAAAG